LKSSIKIKLLVLISSLLLVSVGAYVYFALNIFLTDKTSYIYENTLSTTKLLAKDVEGIISKSTDEAFTLALMAEKNTGLVPSLLDLKSNTLMFEIRGEKRKKLFINSRAKELFKVGPEKLRQYSSDFAFESSKDIAIYNSSKYLGLPSLSILIKNNFNKEEYIYTISTGGLIDSFREHRNFENFLIDNKGNTLIGKNTFSKNSSKNLLENNALALSTKVMENSKDFLLSFYKVEHLGLIIISRISEEEAFKATYFLTKKSILFGLFLTALSLFIGLFFSNTITHPIKDLVEGTTKIATGEYGYQIQVKTNDEVKVLANSFNKMSLKVKDSILELKDANKKLDFLNKNLEKIVIQRTDELKQANEYLDAMINSLDQGLLVFDKNNICNPFFTKACVEIFDGSPSGKDFFNFIGIENKDELKTLRRWSQNLFKESIPFDSIAELGPAKLKLGDNREPKHITLDYYPMRNNESEGIENIVVVATDKTKEVISEKKLNIQKEEARRVVFIVENKLQFLSFLSEFERFNSRLSELAKAKDNLDLSQVKLMLHTMKGGASVFKFDSIAEKIHHAESKLMNNSQKDIKELLTKLVNSNQKSIDKEKFRLQQFLGSELVDGKRRREVKLENLVKFMKKIKQQDLINSFKELIYFIPIKDYFTGYDIFILEVAEKLDKEILPIHFQGGNILIDPTRYESLFQTFQHLIQNMVIHGIETPEERAELKKKEKGLVSITFLENSKSLTISFKDDGRGIDTEAIRELLTKKKIEGAEKFSKEQLCMHVFDEDLTTSNELNNLVGRGIGMSAIKKEIDKLGGNIKISSEKNIGTEFIFEVPLA